MATISLTVVVTNIDVVITLFDRIKVYRSTTGATGPFVEITDGSTRVPLVANVIAYEYADTNGADTYYYKTSFFNSNDTTESSLSDGQLGSGDAALDVLSVDDLKEAFLFGVPLIDGDGNALPDNVFAFYIRAAVAWVEKRLDIPLRIQAFTDAEPEGVDFFKQDYRKWIWLQMKNFPIISVDKVKLVLPTNQNIITYDQSWIKVDKDAGVVQIIPGSGQVVLGAANGWLPFLAEGVDFLPEIFQVSYTAGFTKVPAELVELVGKVASLGPLNILGDLVLGPGVSSEQVGLDGLMTGIKSSRSANLSVYGARILELRREIAETVDFLRRYYKGIRMVMG